MALSPDVERIIREVAGRYQFRSPEVLLATVAQESGGNARAIGDAGASRGWFQENLRGRGAGLTPEQSFDPVASTERAIAEFSRFDRPGQTPGQWAAAAQRPANPQQYAAAIDRWLGAQPPPAGAPASLVSQGPALREGETPDWYRRWQAGASENDLVSRPTPAPPGAAPDWYRQYVGSGGRPPPEPAPGAPPPQARAPAQGPPAAAPPAAAERQAVAASWALSNLGSKAFYDLCQRFIEQAYGTGGQYPSAAAAGKALFKTADPAQADVGDLVFFRPDASNGYSGHAAINLGNGEMVGATNAGVTRDNYLTNPYWKRLLVGFGDPPNAWKGRPSTEALQQGATQLVGAAKAAAVPDWYQRYQQQQGGR